MKRFQQRHGLEVDGRIGRSTLNALNISVSDKIKMIELNLERLRWLPKNYGREYLLVNIPEYKLRAYQKSKLSLVMGVIVGKEYTSTPVFCDTLRYLVFSPTWTVPHSIKSEEMLPRLQRDSSYYSGKNYKFYKGWHTDQEIEPSLVDWSQYSIDHFPFNVVQQPGPGNALGLVKFIMPNNHSIYLHDTPTDHLFERTERALSHGCIRLEEPALLAQYLLRDQKSWDINKILAAMHKDEPERVYFKKNYHVQLTYLTSFVDEFGLINFRDDIYGHDRAQMTEINTIALK
ncbi:L,D-transpeptidase family protein [Fulvivirga sp. M361]|nr:L,D-transpeptidase family protein [Fulvivirga sp. M361]